MSNFDEILNQGKKNDESKEQQITKEPNVEKKDKNDWAEEQKKRRDSLYEMIEAVCPTIVTSPKEMTEFLWVLSRFEKYSLNNNILIYAQKASATKIKDFKGWQEEGGSVKKGAKGFMILEPSPYTKDGEDRIAFNPKTMFDASDVVGVAPAQNVAYDKAMLIRALVNDSPVDIKTVQKYPTDKPEGAYFDVKDNCIYAKAGMDVNDIFVSVAQALACSEIKQESNVPFRVSDHEFQARCIAFVLAQKYGVPSDNVKLYSIPTRYAGYDNEQIKKELAEIHGSVKSITNRMNEILLERPKEQNKNRSDREAR
jgi:hypothetical protein